MIAWQRQGAAIVGSIVLTNGSHGKAVIVAGRDNPKGAMIVTAGAAPGQVVPRPLPESRDELPPGTLIEIICMQERVHGETPLPPPDLL